MLYGRRKRNAAWEVKTYSACKVAWQKKKIFCAAKERQMLLAREVGTQHNERKRGCTQEEKKEREAA
jgi:hypothetical protein